MDIAIAPSLIRTPGQPDNTQPSIVITTAAISPVAGTAGVTYIDVTITANKPVSGLVVGDITPTNCGALNFTAIDARIYTVRVTPTAAGTFSILIPANSCVDSRGNQNTASNTLSLTFADASSYVYNLQNAASITKPKHFRGHTEGSFAEDSDDSTPGFEMFCMRENLGGSQNFGVGVQRAADSYSLGRHDIGAYTNSVNYATAVSNITAARNGNPPTTGAYATGTDTYKAAMKALVLEMRNTKWFDDEVNYESGITDDSWSSRKPTLSFANYCMQKDGTNPVYNFVSGSNADGYTKLDALIPSVWAASAYYRNFMHAEWYYGDYTKDYFAYMNTKLTGHDVFRGRVKDIVEYYWIREAITSITGLGSTITINYAKLYPSSPYQNITTPAWVRVDLTGTVYAGQNITTSHGGRIRSLGSNVYVISCPLNWSNTSATFDILITPTANYMNLTKPVANRSGNNITSDQPCKFILYSKLKTEPYEKNVSIINKSLTFGTAWTIPNSLATSTRDYYLGFINAEGVSGVLQF